MLIDRSKRPIELTAEGSVYFERCQKWLDDYREIEDMLHLNSGKIVGRVRIASIYSVGLLQMSSYVNSFRASHPDVELALSYAQTDDVYKRILLDDADLGIVSFPRDGGEIGCIPWQNQPMVLAVNPEHRLASRSEISIEELNALDFVTFTPDLMICRKSDQLLRKHHVSVNVCHHFDNVENVKRAVEIGIGVALLPLPTMLRELEYETLKAIRLSDVDFVRPLGIIHKRNKHLSRAAEKFVELLQTDQPEAAVLSQGVFAISE